jgi:SAM-dependent methyltransferase
MRRGTGARISRPPAFTCRSCGSRIVENVISLGDVPLVNELVDPDASTPDQLYPLDVVRCSRCTLVQITETVDSSKLFRSYKYFSSYSQTFLDHARTFAERSVERLGLGADSLVIEAASNDGYLLQYFVAAGVPSIGIDPAENVAEVARKRGIETISEFLDSELATRILAVRGTADLVVANNVLAHVPDLHNFVAALRILAGESGLVVVEVPYLCDLVDRAEFDTIYHEHLSYFSLTALERLFRLHHLTILEVERLSIHGGSLRICASASGTPLPAVAKLLAEERDWGVGNAGRFKTFAMTARSVQRELRELVVELVEAGATVAAYGAAAKGVVLANLCGLDAQLICFVVDRNPHKQGLLLPGVRTPIAPPERLARERPDYCLLYAWNLTEEIVAQQAGYRAAGGRFIVPLPTPRILNE